MRSVALALLLASSLALQATQSRVLPSSAQDLWKGTPAGVQVTQNGTLEPGQAWSLAAEFSATPLCALSAGEATFIGTGPSGELWKIASGKPTLLHRFSEPLVTAMAEGVRGKLLVATSGPAKLYEVDPTSGEASLLADLKAQYGWAVAVSGQDVYAATGIPGTLQRLIPGGASETLATPGAAHVRCLAVDGGRLYFGTASPASLLVSDGRSVRRIASFEQEEIVSMAAGTKGLFFALNEKLGAPSAPPPQGAEAGTGSEARQGRGLLYRMERGGIPVRAEAFASAVLSAAWSEGSCWVGTQDGCLFEVSPQGMRLTAKWDKRPLAALLSSSGKAPSVITASSGALWAPGASGSHTFDSPVADGGAPSRATSLEGFGEGAFALSLRCGDGPEPDTYWSPWLPAKDLASLPPGRYFQWRAQLPPAGGNVNGVRLVYRPVNRPPFLESVVLAPPGEIAVRGMDQLGDRLVHELHARQSAFPTLAQSMPSEGGGLSTYYLQGFRMATFKANDPDGDALRADLFLRPEGEMRWFPLAQGVETPFYVFESRLLPEGRYSLKVVVRDSDGNSEGESLSTEREVPLFLVDNTPPSLVEKVRSATSITVTITDGDAVRAARYSVDGGLWSSTSVTAGSFGSRAVTVEIPTGGKGPRWVALEATDLHGNCATKGWLLP